MDRFAVFAPATFDVSGFGAAWEEARAAAADYWQPGSTIGAAEVLVGGAFLLSGEVRLLPTLRALGLIAPS
jgi:hypothetical protein